MDNIREDLDFESQERNTEQEEILMEEQGMVEERTVQGNVHISEEVITELAKKTLTIIPGVQPASPGLVSKLGLVGRKSIDGVKVSVEENVTPPTITVDVFVLVKYGLRIPDVAWDVQESIKNNLEQYTGYLVKAVNINVQGVFFDDRTSQQNQPGQISPDLEHTVEGHEVKTEPGEEADLK
ncbi:MULTISPECIES: Asp23/Gls24 family envelope stress response protein [Aminobacterium]|jgi:uncharacterized alkaline shock family protein YloU|uniref:Asp23/Gls24 family envelope stress response protein n=1 Tax=Aminobacterium TaxID=81466 RepID=UPI002580DEB1|nr:MULTISPECIES: Asp23/Gls24 family envelope stress response protein [unclassified Aminobacterium]